MSSMCTRGCRKIHNLTSIVLRIVFDFLENVLHPNFRRKPEQLHFLTLINLNFFGVSKNTCNFVIFIAFRSFNGPLPKDRLKLQLCRIMPFTIPSYTLMEV